MWASLLLPALAYLAPAQGDPGVPSSIRELYVVEMSHLDIGFTDPPSVVADVSHRHIVDALDVADQKPAFRWTIESAWQLEAFLERATPADVDRLEQRFAEERFVLGAGYNNLHSGLFGEEELHRFVQPAASMAARLGARFDACLIDDVPGVTLAFPRVLARSGVKYVLLGKNDFIGGDPDIPWIDRPFWWQGKDGSRVLAWLPYASYAEGLAEWGMLTLPSMYAAVSQLLPEIEGSGYPYDAVLVMRGFDNAGVSAGMANLAETWNATYQNPKIKLATPQEFFEHLIAKYGDVFPTYTGDAAGLWESVTMTTPASTAITRRARARLPDLEALWSAALSTDGAGASRYPLRRFREAWRLALVMDEHSGGGLPWPGLMTEAEANQQNEEFVAFALALDELVDGLHADVLEVAGPVLVPVDEEGLVLFNPLGEAFDGVVEVDFGAPQPVDLALIDPAGPAGGPAASFRWTEPDRSALALRVQVPARGWRRFELAGGGSTPPHPAIQTGDRIASGSFELVLDTTHGTAKALTDSASGVDWLDQDGPHRFGGIERGANLEAFFSLWEHADPTPVTVYVEGPTPVFRRARVVDREGKLLREYRLYEPFEPFENGPRVDVTYVLWRSDLAVVHPVAHSHHYAIAFPANLETPTRLLVDGPDGWYEPGAESLPGAALGHFATATGAVLFDANGRWQAISSPDSPMLDLGEMTEAPADAIETDENGLAWKLIRHASVGEVVGGGMVPIEAEPGLPDDVRFAFIVRFGEPGDPPPDRETLRRDLAPPLVVVVAEGQGPASLPAAGVLHEVAGPAELIAYKRSEAGDGWVVRLRAGPGGGTVILKPPAAPTSAWLADLLERPESRLPIAGGQVSVPLAPDGVTTVLLRD
ncbi:MAG: hypothetical protein O7B99_15065 [Planctomycetota bacterium]|nr:hypothetical protein [Planctomycetota bacterium]